MNDGQIVLEIDLEDPPRKIAEGGAQSVFIRHCERIGAREADGSVLYTLSKADRRTDLRSSPINTLSDQARVTLTIHGHNIPHPAPQ